MSVFSHEYGGILNIQMILWPSEESGFKDCTLRITLSADFPGQGGLCLCDAKLLTKKELKRFRDLFKDQVWSTYGGGSL